jgi:hypothetical protein
MDAKLGIDGWMPPETPDDRVIDATGKFILPASLTRIATSRFTRAHCLA